jgi:hypothetical protein
MALANLYDGANQAVQSFHEVMQIKATRCAMQRSWLHTVHGEPVIVVDECFNRE